MTSFKIILLKLFPHLYLPGASEFNNVYKLRNQAFESLSLTRDMVFVATLREIVNIFEP